MAVDGSKKAKASATQPPRKINVQKFVEARANELESLHSAIATRVNDDFRSRRNKRRRTTAFDSQAAKKRSKKRKKVAVLDNKKASSLEKKDKENNVKIPRRVRRRLELKKNPESGFCTSSDGTKRLRTHVWHAKRFTMTKLWGFHLPLGLQGRGRGCRAVLKWFKEGVLIHDASYNVAIQLEGLEDALISVLQMVLVPSPASQSKDSSVSLSGHTYGTAMLHHVGGPLSRPIAPVKYMWRPPREGGYVDKGHDGVGCSEQLTNERGSCFRQLWIWIHASAFDEGYDALKFVCEKQMNGGSTVISCFSREGQLGKLELMGSKAFESIQKAVQPVASTVRELWQLKKSYVDCNYSHVKDIHALVNEEQVSPCAILSYTIMDPRLLSDGRAACDPQAASTGNIPEVEVEQNAPLSGILDGTEEMVSSLSSKTKENNSLSDKTNLWDVTSAISLPQEEDVLCAEKHHRQMDLFCLDHHDLGHHTTLTRVNHSRSCSVILLKDNDHDSPPRWSVILPLSWVKVFWIFLVSKGAHAIGLRERHCVACDIGIPYFPSDFPDCNAYSILMESEAVACQNEAERRPPALRPFKVPIQPPWNTVRDSVERGFGTVQDTQISSKRDNVDENSLTTPSCEKSVATSSDSYQLFDGIVARTSTLFDYFLNSISCDNLILFPEDPSKKSALLKFMKDKSLFDNCQDGMTKMSSDRKLCFLRVHLHAYRKGFFEEGAVVCAPSFADIALWTSSSKSIENGLQMSQLSVRSYFKEVSSGNWELQVPEESTAWETFRWPIGFVTTGFIRGSKKPKAEAFCEGGLLARLREEQWTAIPAKKRRKEVYVLVRNLRSSAYRFALAAIVLEQQEDDVTFM